MNRVEKLSIGGYAFNLEEDAAKSLEVYMDRLRKGYASAPDGAEIIEAFEDRICEMLLENHPGDSVVSVSDIEAVKSVLGDPQTIFTSAGEEEPSSSAGASTSQEEAEKPQWWKNDTKKRIFRPRGGRVIGGVCSGLANYFGIDVTLVRIIWVVMFLCGGIFDMVGILAGISSFALLSYVLLWICIPSASQSQEMLYAKNHDAGETNSALKVLGRILRVFLGLLFIIIGVSGLVAGVALIFGISWLGISAEATTIMNDILEVVPGIASVASLKVLAALLSLCYFLPCLIFLYEGLKLCFAFRSPSWHPGLILTIIWIAAVVASGIIIALSIVPTLTT